MFQSGVWQRLSGYYNWYVLGLVSVGYILGELGHYLIGTTSKVTADDLHYGDKACMLNATHLTLAELPTVCEKVNSSDVCTSLIYQNATYCEWGYNGLGLEYQVLAGPAFMAVFTVVGVVLGVVADKYNRARVLSFCTLVFVIAIILMGTVTEYWHLVVLRMIMAAGESGCNPLATGILTDLFPEHQRALVLSIFNWGIYGGYGIAFPVGRYIPELNAFGLSWRLCYYGVGVVGLVVAFFTFLTLREPPRTTIGEEGAGNAKGGDASLEAGTKQPQVTIWHVIAQPRILLLCFAASIRHCGGMTFAYNADLYYRDYFPDVDLGWWLFAVTVGIGSIGVVAGGVISDKFVARMGIRSRVLVLALSQLIATLPAFGSVIFGPLWAMITLAISYFFAEMWFGIVFAILVEIVPLSVRSTTVGVFLFVMNNVGGNLPILVDPVSKAIGYREAIMIFYAGFYGLSSILFFLTMFLMDGPVEKPEAEELPPANKMNGLDNRAFTHDEARNARAASYDANSRL
ncbi:putative metabolite transport protein HI_1104 [Plutella xylostella]|uniref:putative metabolite transport protein HI_1104 n=1 Tax=Plutella xylostella TaxID=51655 RepID=UPI002032328F|nr:putative metabolite transport protein HI_1104 [Plutella xylostella]XP_048482382.1 putative metabolite transport protein HI_1104 [Plutella xylostella]